MPNKAQPSAHEKNHKERDAAAAQRMQRPRKSRSHVVIAPNPTAGPDVRIHSP